MKRCYSLKRNKEFRHVYRRGKSKADPHMVLVWTGSRRSGFHVGLSVSKKIGNSVARNRVKRRMREAISPLIGCIKHGYDLIFIAREPVAGAKFTDIAASVHSLLHRADLLKGKETRP